MLPLPNNVVKFPAYAALFTTMSNESNSALTKSNNFIISSLFAKSHLYAINFPFFPFPFKDSDNVCKKMWKLFSKYHELNLNRTTTKAEFAHATETMHLAA